MEILDGPEYFEEVGIFYAMEDMATRRVIQYKPGSLGEKSGG